MKTRLASWLIIILLVAVASTGMAAGMYEEDEEEAPSLFRETQVYPFIELHEWRDFGSLPNRDFGTVYGVGLTGALDLHGGTVLLRPKAEVFTGTPRYEGLNPAGVGETDYTGLKAQLDLDYRFSAGRAAIAPFVGVGIRWWNRDINVDTVERFQRWFAAYASGGARAVYDVTKEFSAYAEAGAIFPFYARVAVDLSGGSSVAETPSGNLSAFAELGGIYKGFKPGLFFEGWNFKEKGNQPKGEAVIYGLKVGYLF